MSVEDIRCLACLVDREDSKASSVFRTAKGNMKEGKGRREEVEGDRGRVCVDDTSEKEAR